MVQCLRYEQIVLLYLFRSFLHIHATRLISVSTHYGSLSFTSTPNLEISSVINYTITKPSHFHLIVLPDFQELVHHRPRPLLHCVRVHYYKKKYDGSQTNNAESNNLKLIGICGEKACCGASSWLSRILQCACWRGGPSCSCHEHGDPQRSDHGTHGACGQETRSS